MIVKIKSFKKPDFGKLLKYMLHEGNRLFTKDEQSFLITHNLKGNSISQWEKQFKENETLRLRRRKDNVILTHEILSWHSNDSKDLTLDKLHTMGKEYIRLRNPNGIFVVVPHFNKDHCHLHICASGIEYKSGKSLRLSKANFGKLKKDIQVYQKDKFPELTESIVAHGKKIKSTVSDREYHLRHKHGRDSEKEKVEKTILQCFKKSKSKEVFYDLIRKSGLSIYECSGKITGVKVGNYKYRFNRLGLTDAKLNELTLVNTRTMEMDSLRTKSNNLVRIRRR